MWSDRETEHDCLGYSSYVSVLATISTHPDIAPLTLGIFGSWGSGKTSLMRMLQNRIEADAKADNKLLTLWFNAWRYEGREEAQSALIHAILATLKQKRTLGEEAKTTLKKLAKSASILKLGKFIMKSAISLTPDIDGFIDCFSEESDKLADTMEGFERDFNELLKSVGLERIVVFIDDLDRCSSLKVIETFETIKLFLNTPACTFVIGADAEKIEHAVGEVYQVADKRRREDYLEKIVQIPFNIPEQDQQDIACYVGMLLVGRHLNAAGWHKLCQARTDFYANKDDALVTCFGKWAGDNKHLFPPQQSALVDAELKDILRYVPILARGLRGNPRQLKRFLNILALRRKLAEENKLTWKADLLVKLSVLEYADRDFFHLLVENVDPETGCSTLIEEMLKADGKGDESSSQLVTEALAKPGRLDFLKSEPPLGGKTDLSPYLFLAQTSLSRIASTALAPVDEQVQALVNTIATADPVPSKAAAARAASKDPAIAGAIVKALVTELPRVKDPATQTHILIAMQTICRRHRDLFPLAVRAAESLEPGQQSGVALTGAGLLADAKAAGASVSDELIAKYNKASPLAALVGKGRGRKEVR